MDIELWHPKLKGKNYKLIKINKNLNDFNCIAFVLDDYDRWRGSSTDICR